MSIPRKLTCFGMALLLTAVAVTGASICPQQLMAMNPSGNDMAMMGMPMSDMDSSQMGLHEARTDLCCQVAPAELPKQTSRVSAGEMTGEVPLAAPAGQITGSEASFVLNAHARADGPPRQALLCVFLI